MTKGKDGKSRWNWRVDESKGERGEREGEDSRIEQAREREAPRRGTKTQNAGNYPGN